jgi:two-component system, NarL family, response regulator LiaR
MNMKEKKQNIRVLLADDHSITRNGLKTIFSLYDDIVLVGEASDGMEAVKICKKNNPDIVLMDLDMPIMDGVAATVIIRKECPRVKVIALTSFIDKKLVNNAIKAGASSYIVKNISTDELIKAIRSTFLGKIILSPQAMKAIVEEIKNPSVKKINLTVREINVLEFLVKGCSNKEIAQKLFISNHTVKFHVNSILSKFEVRTRTEAAYLATQQNLLR